MILLHRLMRVVTLMPLIFSTLIPAYSFATHKRSQYGLTPVSSLQSRDISDLGINCEGDWWHCYGVDGVLDAILRIVPYLSDWDVYFAGAHIACFRAKATFIAALFADSSNGFCLFLQGDRTSTQQIVYPDGHSVSAVNGSQIKSLTRSLRAYGCNGCGSIPLDTSGANDPHALGILTVNYVNDREGCGDRRYLRDPNPGGQANLEITRIVDDLCTPSLRANESLNPYWQWSVVEAIKNNGSTTSATANLPPVELNATTLIAARQVGLGALVKWPDNAPWLASAGASASASQSTSSATPAETPGISPGRNNTGGTSSGGGFIPGFPGGQHPPPNVAPGP